MQITPDIKFTAAEIARCWPLVKMVVNSPQSFDSYNTLDIFDICLIDIFKVQTQNRFLSILRLNKEMFFHKLVLLRLHYFEIHLINCVKVTLNVVNIYKTGNYQPKKDISGLHGSEI